MWWVSARVGTYCEFRETRGSAALLDRNELAITCLGLEPDQ